MPWPDAGRKARGQSFQLNHETAIVHSVRDFLRMVVAPHWGNFTWQELAVLSSLLGDLRIMLINTLFLTSCRASPRLPP